MQEEAPFTKYVLEKDRYVLIHLIRYLSPRDLRALAATCKACEAIYMVTSKFVDKAFKTTIQGKAVQLEQHTRLTYRRTLKRQSQTNRLIHDLTGRIFNIVIEEKARSTTDRYWLSKEAMYKTALMYSRMNQKRDEIPTTYPNDLPKEVITGYVHAFFDHCGKDRIAKDIRNKTRALRDAKEDLEMTSATTPPHKQYNNSTSDISNALEIIIDILVDEADIFKESCILYNSYHYSDEKDKLTNIMKDIEIGTVTYTETLLQTLLEEVEEYRVLMNTKYAKHTTSMEKTKGQEGLISTLSPVTTGGRVLSMLKKPDIKNLILVSKKMEWTLSEHQTLWEATLLEPLLRGLPKTPVGKAEETIIKHILKHTKGTTKRYQIVRRLITAAIKEREVRTGTKDFPWRNAQNKGDAINEIVAEIDDIYTLLAALSAIYERIPEERNTNKNLDIIRNWMQKKHGSYQIHETTQTMRRPPPDGKDTFIETIAPHALIFTDRLVRELRINVTNRMLQFVTKRAIKTAPRAWY